MKKNSDLKIPFSWEERRSILLERCLYIPPLYERHEEWNIRPWSEIFGNERPVAIEYCSGNGQWIAQRAKARPELNWVAVEKQFERARKIWVRSFRENLPNLFVVAGEGRAFSRYYVPKKSVAEVYVNFPDPWPKRRHAKHRLVQREFLEELAQIGIKGMKGTFVTDDGTYRDQMIEALQSNWRSRIAAPYFTTDWPEYGSSFFEGLWREKGKAIYYLPWEMG